MKDLEEVLKTHDIHFDDDKSCDGCPYEDDPECNISMTHDLYKHLIKLKEENERLKYSKNIYEETMVLFSDTIKELLGDMKALKEENNKLKEEGKKLIIEMYRMDQYK